jgi:hypothetical protein
MNYIEHIQSDNKIVAIVIRWQYIGKNIEFFTPGEFSQQLGYMRHAKGDQILPHVHVIHQRTIEFTQETLFIRKGVVKVDLYRDDKSFLTHRVLSNGDVIMLASGGHGVEFLTDAEIIEVKQGPYCGDEDKVRF